MPDAPHHNRKDLQEVKTRNRIARETITALSESMAALSIRWNRLYEAVSDTPHLVAEIAGLREELEAVRLALANLAAAARAALAADHDREADPLSYLRDELRAQGWTDRGSS